MSEVVTGEWTIVRWDDSFGTCIKTHRIGMLTGARRSVRHDLRPGH